jgi:lipid-binding SYLF domain-containing protein
MSKLFTTAIVVALVACSTKTPSMATQRDLEQQARITLRQMQDRDSSLESVVRGSAAYAVFPSVGAAGAVVGGAFGRGILFAHGQAIGYVELKQGSIGLQLGGQTYSELLVLHEPFDVDRVKAGTYEMGANAQAVILKEGAHAAGSFERGSTVFVMAHGGAMVGVSLSGQHISYAPLA